MTRLRMLFATAAVLSLWGAPQIALSPEGGLSVNLVSPAEARGYGDRDTFNMFWRELRPHGRWVKRSPYGWVWVPRVQRYDSDWRPYTRGTQTHP